MTRAEITALFARREEAWQHRDAAALTADHAENAIGDSPMQGQLIGRARIHDVYNNWFSAFPDLTFKTEALLIDGNRVAQFFIVSGTHSAPFGAVPPTGRKFQITGAWLYTLGDDGRIVHDRRVYDVTHLLVQLGALRTKPSTQ